jgi:cytochrome c oxidase subunit III
MHSERQILNFPIPANKKLGMWLFVISDGFTFASILAAYFYLRTVNTVWPAPFTGWSGLVGPALMTLCLVSSSLTLSRAVHSKQAGDIRMSALWILFTIILGKAFLSIHLVEWNSLVNEGLSFSALPDTWAAKWPGATPLFGSIFFSVTGLHILHVATGLVYLLVLLVGIRRYRPEDLEVCAIYWHFVDIVWISVFISIYLL